MSKIAFQFDQKSVLWHAVRSSGSGGQNVNKVSTAVAARLPLRASGLPEALIVRVRHLYGTRLNADDELCVKAQEFRTQELNREAAIDRIRRMLETASIVPQKRIPTRPCAGARRRRLEEKARRADVKRSRRAFRDDF